MGISHFNPIAISLTSILGVFFLIIFGVAALIFCIWVIWEIFNFLGMLKKSIEWDLENRKKPDDRK